jgi:predicted nucleic acid-binding protein
MLYLDTSSLVAAVTNETATRRMHGWLGKKDPDDPGISDWVVAEFSAALSIKLRTGAIEATDRAGALTMFTRICNENLAARFADQYALGLRAGDALHLAICAEQGATLCMLDRRLSEAASVLRISTALL